MVRIAIKLLPNIAPELILKSLLILLLFLTFFPILGLKSDETAERIVETTTVISTSKSVAYEIRLVEDITIDPESGEEYDIEVEFLQGDEIRIELSSSLGKPVVLTVYDPENILLMRDKTGKSISHLLLQKNGTYRMHLSDFSGGDEISLKILKLENKLTFYYTITMQTVMTKYVSEQNISPSEISQTTYSGETTSLDSQSQMG